METIKLRDEFIKLGQALKAANLVQDGVEAKRVAYVYRINRAEELQKL